MTAKNEKQSALEKKLSELDSLITEKTCFGLRVEGEAHCEECHLSERCPEYAVARLIREDEGLEYEDASREVEVEMQNLGLTEKPLVVDWSALIGKIIGERPDSTVAVLDIIADFAKCEKVVAGKYANQVLQKLVRAGACSLSSTTILWR